LETFSSAYIIGMKNDAAVTHRALIKDEAVASAGNPHLATNAEQW
jgi:hypothetical protein